MLRRWMTLAAVVLTVAACETATEETGAAGAGGLGAAAAAPASRRCRRAASSAGQPVRLDAACSAAPLGNPAEVERELVVGDTVYFAFDSFSLDSQAQGTLDRQAALLLKSTASTSPSKAIPTNAAPANTTSRSASGGRPR